MSKASESRRQFLGVTAGASALAALGVTSKSCSCAGTLPVSGRSECHCMLLAFSPLTMSFERVFGGSV